MKIAFQIDEITKLNFALDTSYVLMQEAYERGVELYFYYPDSVSWVDNKVISSNLFHVKQIIDIKEVQVGNIPIIYTSMGEHNLAEMDIIFLRQNPPFDMAYITSTFLLEKLMPKVKVVNNPVSVRNSPEKLLVTEFYQYMPKTVITRDMGIIMQFIAQQPAVIKPLYGNAGSDVFFLKQGDFNATSIVQYFLNTFKEQIMVQAFLENVKHGDKRIILIDGEAAGVINRIPAQGEIKSNLAAGGKAAKVDLIDKDKEICQAISSRLKKLGLFFVGIDVIDGYITEINVTSPTGLRSIIDLQGVNLAKMVWDKLLK